MKTQITKAQNGLKYLEDALVIPMSTKFGENSKSHHLIVTPTGKFMRSYETLIAFISNEGEVVLNTVYDQSNTTNFYRCQFLGERVNETRKKLKSGEYAQTELN